MKNLRITDQILENQQVYIPKLTINLLASIVASFFSAIFSMSILFEAKKQIDEPSVFILLFVFIVLFLSYNEYIKTTELRKKFLKQRSSWALIVVTFLISMCLSGIGIYLWTNKSLQNNTVNDKRLSQTSLQIEAKYNRLLDSIQNTSIEDEPEYIRLKSDIKYWKQRSAADLNERSKIRERIKGIELDLGYFNQSFDQRKLNSIKRYEGLKNTELEDTKVSFRNETKFITRNNNLSLIFFIAVLITKFIIILLAKDYSNLKSKEDSVYTSDITRRFVSQYRFITNTLSRKSKITFDDVTFSNCFKFSKDEKKRTKEIKDIFYLLGDLKLLEVSLPEAQEKLKSYYDSIINI